MCPGVVWPILTTCIARLDRDRMTRQSLQRNLLRANKLLARSHLLSTGWGRSVFEFFYHWYKACLEVGNIDALASFITPGTTAIDVGANVGYFTKRFAAWVSRGGKVIAIEPEPINFERLTRMLQMRGLSPMVEAIQAVAADVEGTLNLQINPVHPGDHKLAQAGLPVTAHTIDTLLANRRWPAVSLIKIDVQGAEEKVLRGARETIRRFRPAIFLEVDDNALVAMNSSAVTVLSLLTNEGYAIYKLASKRISPPMQSADALSLCREGRYADLLFIHEGNSTSHQSECPPSISSADAR